MTIIHIGLVSIAVGLIFRGIFCFTVGAMFENDCSFREHPILAFLNRGSIVLGIIGSICIGIDKNFGIGILVFIAFWAFSRPLMVTILFLLTPIIAPIYKYYLQKGEDKNGNE